MNKYQHIISEYDAPITVNRQWFQCHRCFQEKDIGIFFLCGISICCSALLKQGASRAIRLVFWLRPSLCSWRNHRFLTSFYVLCFLMLHHARTWPISGPKIVSISLEKIDCPTTQFFLKATHPILHLLYYQFREMKPGELLVRLVLTVQSSNWFKFFHCLQKLQS